MKKSDVALLRPVLSDNGEINENARAVARLKKTDGRDVVSVSICGLPNRSGGEYYFFLEGNIPPFFRIFDTSGGEFSVYDRNAAGATAICYVTQNSVIIDLYGAFSADGLSEEEVKDYAQTYFFGNESANGKESFHGEKEDERAGRREENDYDDEIIADKNYYEFGDVDIRNLKVKDDNGDENENVGTDACARGEQKEKTRDDRGFEDEKEKSGVFFEKIRANLKELFEDYPAEKNLEEMVADSKWVKIDYDAGKFYVVGVIYENEKPAYMCYGAPGKRAEKPDEMKGYCSFIPSSPFDLKNDGYWVMFQSAVSGARL